MAFHHGGKWVSAIALFAGLIPSSHAQETRAGAYIWGKCKGDSCLIAEVTGRETEQGNHRLTIFLLTVKNGKIEGDRETGSDFLQYRASCKGKKPVVTVWSDGDETVVSVDVKQSTLEAAVWTYACTGRIKGN